MKKCKNKIITIILSIFACFSLTSCVTEETRNDIISKLQKQNIISEEYALLDIVANSAAPVPDISSYDYIFTTSVVDKDDITNKNEANIYDSGAIVIRIYTKDKNDVYDIKYFHNVDIYFNEHTYTDSEGNENVEEYYDVNSLDWGNTDEYYVKYTKYIFGKKLIMTDKEGNSLFVKNIQDKLSNIASKFTIWQ